MVERKRPKSYPVPAKRPKGYPPETYIKKGEVRNPVGRPKGRPNKVHMELKEAILEGAAMCGYNGEGKGEAAGYFYRIAKKNPELYTRLVEKILPMQVSGPGGGPIKLMALPPETLSKLTAEQLSFLQNIYESMAGRGPSLVQGSDGVHTIDQEAEEYAQEIGFNDNK